MPVWFIFAFSFWLIDTDNGQFYADGRKIALPTKTLHNIQNPFCK